MSSNHTRDSQSYCPVCNKFVRGNYRGIQCDIHNFWFRLVCGNLTLSYRELGNSSENWQCYICLSPELPFMSVHESAILDNCFNSLTIDASCKLFSICDIKMKSNPLIFHSDSGDLTADISSLCKYYDPADLCTEINLNDNVSSLRVSIRRMRVNFDALSDYLGTLKFKLDFIALSETWLSSDNHDLFFLSGYVCFLFPR